MTLPTPGEATWQAAKQIVADAADLPQDQRQAFVAAQCAGNDRLLTEVRSLLVHLDLIRK